MTKDPVYSKEQREEIIEAASGDAILQRVLTNIASGDLIGTACKKAGMHAKTFYLWLRQHPSRSRLLLKIFDERSSTVEESLYKKAVVDGDVTAMIFWLKNRSKERWQDTQHITQEFKEYLFVEYENLTDDDLDKELCKLQQNNTRMLENKEVVNGRNKE